MFRYKIFLLLFLFPNAVSASVIINEIAWMGTNNSANDEWIELYNNGAADIDLSGWKLEAEDGTPLINLSGIVSADGFFLLERTDDSSVPSVTADLIYTGALENGGEILILKDDTGTEIQKLDASAGWSAGDNSTKQTMQWNGSVWGTDNPTPGAQNVDLAAPPPSDNPPPPLPPAGGGGGLPAGGWPVEPQIFAKIEANNIAIVGAQTEFLGKALGLQKKSLENARYLWNFGDGSTGESEKLLYSYKFPGEYILILDVSSGQYSASDRMNIKAVPNELIISEVKSGEDGFVELYNRSKYEIDISNWRFKTGNQLFIFPKNSFVGAGSRLKISSLVIGLNFSDGDTVRLAYSNGSTAFEYVPEVDPPVLPKLAKPTVKTVHLEARPLSEKQDEVIATSSAQALPSSAQANVIASVDTEKSNFNIWFLSVLGFAILSAGGLILSRRS